jgi:hypothetical protein
MYDYRPQLPNMNVGFFSPRFMRANQLGRVVRIAVDASPLSRPEGLYIPGFANQIVSALWISAVINSYHLNRGDISFLKDNEAAFMDKKTSPQDLYAAVEFLNQEACPFNWDYTLSVISSWENLLLCLMEGFTVMVGASVYESFYGAEISGIVPMPKPGEALLGGQIVNIISFDQDKDLAEVIGNQGKQCGQRGIFTYRGSHLRNLQICRDFFTLIPRYKNAN